MQVKLKDGSIQHLQSDTAKALIKLGLAEQYSAPKSEVRHATSWAVRPGERVEDWQGPPRINFHCACGVKGFTRGSVPVYNRVGESIRPGAKQYEYLPFVMKHADGAEESIPGEIMGEFLRLYKAWQARSRRKSVPGRFDRNKNCFPPTPQEISAAQVHVFGEARKKD
jgi:hypothetical protein